jgi:hypothetical protein
MGVIWDTEQQTNKMRNDFEENRMFIIDVDQFEVAKGMKFPKDGRLRSWYLRETDFGQKGKGSIYPKVPSKESFLNWYITPERHQAYSNFWLFLTCVVLGSNVFIYLI